MSERLNIQIPFCGFYESLYSGEVDSIEEREAEHFADERQEEEAIPSELRLEAGEVQQMLFECTNYGDAYAQIAKEYADSFNSVLSDAMGLKLSLEFDEMTSPREYNFTTDRIFCTIPLEAVEQLFARSVAEGHVRLRKVLQDRHSSYDGFYSHYSNDIEDWLDKPVSEWDHNELMSLLIAFMPDRDEWEMDIYYAMNEACYSAWSDAVDWAKFDAKVAERREELAEERREIDPDYIMPPPRCDRTIDMFTGREG